MDNTPGLGAAMEASSQRDKIRALENKLADLERQLAALKGQRAENVYRADASRSYTLDEINALRTACSNKYLFGRYDGSSDGFSRSYMEDDKNAAVERMVKSHMQMGITAADLIASEPSKRNR